MSKENVRTPDLSKCPEGWEWTGEVAGEGRPIVSNGKERRILVNGGLLRCDGNPGNAGGGRIADKVRLDATKGLESEVARIGTLLKTLIDRAGAELAEGGNVSTGLATMREVSRVASTLTSIGPGTKVTNVVEAPELFEVFDTAMTEEGVPNDLALRVMARVKAWKDGS